MILSNTEILRAIRNKEIKIGDLTGNEPPGQAPLNTTAIDLHLSTEITIPSANFPAMPDLTKSGIARLIAASSTTVNLSASTPYKLKRFEFVLAQTKEILDFPIPHPRNKNRSVYAARVEGRSSVARCGVMVHFTAPTIHAGFEGPITLEIVNLGQMDFPLTPGMAICQLIIEQIKGQVVPTTNQFKGQRLPTGLR